MLDDENILKQRDSDGALDVAASEWQQASYDAVVQQGEHDGREIQKVVLAGMGGSALAALIVKSWLNDTIPVPFEIVRDYTLPNYVDESTLVIASSCSGNTEETLSCLDQAEAKNVPITILTSGGKLLERAKANGAAYIVLPDRTQLEPRMTTIAQIRALTKILAHFGVIDGKYYDEIADASEWLQKESGLWDKSIPTEHNYAKLHALIAVGRTPVFYGGSLMAPLAYKWKISWNENAKNVAFWNFVPENNHNEFIGWTSHPVEKPFAVFDLVSELEHPRIQKRFNLNDRLLSGMRPKSTVVPIQGDTVLKQFLWGCILADFVSIYVAILNGVDPTQVNLIEKLKTEMSK
ncbi:MAG: bifunctional phosphoglucose/phosphomannose isomerase [Candidatus Saccharimonas sp.]